MSNRLPPPPDIWPLWKRILLWPVAFAVGWLLMLCEVTGLEKI